MLKYPTFNEKVGEDWLRRWGIFWEEYKREVELGVEGPNHVLFDTYAEKILAEEWLMEYAVREYKKGKGLTVTEFLRMLVNVYTH